MFVNQSPKQLLRAISSFFSIISNSLNRRSIHNNRLIFLRKCPAASPAILPAVSTGSTFEIVALITKRLPVYRFIASASESCDPAEIQLSPEFFRIPHKPLHTVFAVSYTHLDVYKRQDIPCGEEKLRKILFGKSIFLLPPTDFLHTIIIAGKVSR